MVIEVSMLEYSRLTWHKKVDAAIEKYNTTYQTYTKPDVWFSEQLIFAILEGWRTKHIIMKFGICFETLRKYRKIAENLKADYEFIKFANGGEQWIILEQD